MFNFFVDESAQNGDRFCITGADCNHIRNVLRIVREDLPLIVGGGDPLRTVFATLLAHEGVRNMTVVSDEQARLAPNIGAMMTYREHIRQKKA